MRNHVIVVNATAELAAIARKAAALVPGAVPVVHQHGYAQFPEDRDQTFRALVGNAANPNVHAALFLGFGDETDDAEAMAEAVRNRGRNAHAITLREAASLGELMAKAANWLRSALNEADAVQRVAADASHLVVGLECGGSDGWSGITANPAIGEAADLIVAQGGTVILSETPEAIGAEHILANQAESPEVAEAFLRLIADYEKRIQASGADIRSANPSPGNVRGGLTTLEEKSLGCIKKGGTTPLREAIRYADVPSKKGFVFMDSPGYDVDSVTGMTAGGAQIVLFSTGRGSPTGSPIAPVIKVSTNSRLYERMSDHIDVDAGVILTGSGTLASVGADIFAMTMAVARGELAAAERNGNAEFSVWRMAESI